MKKGFLITVLIALLAFFATATSVFAEGSRDLVQFGGNRPYLEWYDGTTLGIVRKNTMNVFARNGESILVGSSVYEGSDSSDIVVTSPSGEITILDVIKDGKGFISGPATEAIGPYPQSGGYDPLVITVRQTGIYKIQFHSKDSHKNENPPAVLASKKFPTDSMASVAAFDATVVSKGGEEIKGRAYFNFICLNSGPNSEVAEGVKSEVYVLTNDGYEYKISLNGMNPYGFILFSNNRGFIDPVGNTSLYKTVAAKDNAMTSLMGGIKILAPTGENTKTNITHKIFLNRPALDLPESIPTTAALPADVTSVSFNGVDKNKASEGNGGLFTIELSKDATYTIFLDADNNGSFEDEVDVKLANAGVKGKNTIYWDGKDGLGETVKPGIVGVKAMAKGGEYHFPLLDAEVIANGIKVELLNAPRSYEGFDPFEVYYDDTDYVTAGGNAVKVRGVLYGEGTMQNYKYPQIMIKPASATDGINSENGVLAYGSPSLVAQTTSHYGNQKGFDFWTYYEGNSINASLEVVAQEVETTAVTGNLFYDKNSNSVFDLTEDGISGIEVDIKDATGKVLATAVTDNVGNYSAVVESTSDGKYTVIPRTAPAGYVLTTSGVADVTAVQPGVVYVSDIGYSYTLDVAVEISVDKAESIVGDTVTFTVKAINNTIFEANNVSVEAALPAYLKFVSANSSDFDPETGEWNIGALGNKEIKQLKVVTTTFGVGDFNYISSISAQGDLATADAFDNNFDNVTYSVSKKPAPPYVIPELHGNFAYIFGRSDTRMEAGDNMLRGEVSATIYRLKKQNSADGNPDGFVYDATSAPLFAGIEGRWDRSAIEYMSYMGMYKADRNLFINPMNPIKRGEAFKAICIGLGFTKDTSLTNDQYTEILCDAGFVIGDENGDLGVNNFIKRAEFCKIYNAIIKRDLLDLSMVSGGTVTPETYGFVDLDPGAWYYGIMLRATSAYNDNGYVDTTLRAERNVVDDYIVAE